MKKRILKKSLVISIMLLFIGIGIVPSSSFNLEKQSTVANLDGDTLYVGGSGSNNYTKIQDAIDNASDGDTVFVYNDSSPYYENVIIDKSINLIGENRNTTIIGNESGDVVYVSADWVNISGFTIRNSGYPYWVIGISSNYNTITGNNISSNNVDGIYLYSSSNNNTITGNNILNNRYGIYLYSSSGNTITGNNISSNNNDGIYLYSSSNNNNITGNNISNNRYGIYLRYSSNNNNITGNNISNNMDGIYLRDSSNNNNITGNNISNDIHGIYLYSSNSNIITGNSFFNDGLHVYYSYQNTVSNNTVNDKPLVYLENESDIVIDIDAGQIILIKCDNITVQNQELSNASIGIWLCDTNNCLFSGNTIRNGIYLFSSSNNNNITGNNITSNNGYGIYLYDSSSSNNITGNNISNSRYGICLSSSSGNNNITGNNILNNRYGIYLSSSSNNNNITGNNISNNEAGIYLYDSSSNNTITFNNISSNNDDGIYIRHSSNNTVTDNNISNNGNGIYLSSSSNNNITRNNIRDNWNGIYLSSSSNNNITGNSFFNDGLRVWDSYQNTVSNNTVNGKPLVYLENESDLVIDDAGQIILIKCDNITVQNQELSNASIGIWLCDTNNCLFSGNIISSNNRNGIYLYSSSGNTVTDNSISNNGNGIYLESSNSNNITGNSISSNNVDGIYLYSSSGNNITGNNISNNIHGIRLYSSSGNTIKDNTINSNNDDGIYLESSSGNIITGNNISNNRYGIRLSSNSNIITGNNISSNNRYGIYLYSSNSNIITGNNISSNNRYGIYLRDSSNNNNITGNNISNNDDGIYLYSSSGNTIKDNTINSNNDYGIYLYSSSSNNNITGNNIISNDYGIVLWFPVSNNTIYNNYFNNINNVYDGGNNTWNISKTLGNNIIGGPYLGGNYWSDYTGVDLDGDGLGDTDLPYNSSGNIHNGGDWLPLVNSPPYEPSNPDPPDGVTSIDINSDLSWDGGDPDSGDTVTYDVYFGTTSLPPKVVSNQSGTTYDPGTMSYNTHYYWKIVAWDNHGASSEGPIWDFTTEEAPEPDLDCDGSLSWTDVEPGSIVEGSFTVENIGESGSLLDWEIIDWPKDWGNWTFTPLSGNDLTPEAGPVTVNVSVVAPDEKNKNFSGNIMIVNKENSNDYCTIRVYLSTPKNKAYFNFNLLEQKLIKNRIN